MNSQPDGITNGPKIVLAERICRLLDMFPTRRAAAAAAGVSTDQITRYGQGRSAPPFEVMARLAERQNVSLDWLASGTGPMHRGAGQDRGEGLPVIGLTAARDRHWYLPRELGVRLPPPTDPHAEVTFAVLAVDDALLTEGVRPGHVCFAFKGIEALRGDLVYVIAQDGRVALRRYDGAGVDGYRLTYFAPDGEPVTEQMDPMQVDSLCPVVKIRRKW